MTKRVTLKFTHNTPPDDQVVQFKFRNQDELDGFMQGIDAAIGWENYEWIEGDEPTAYQEEDEDEQ